MKLPLGAIARAILSIAAPILAEKASAAIIKQAGKLAPPKKDR